ncbi:UDP-2,4-diacetamido-2,4,6-trideoxy-beta-L-altropyranose hydrolase [Thioalkalivibrio sp. ALE19]|uniref:UDP-2,4-diacetamido-2,4, 6-trideoxy-beta-L-altropyranose hydrolase n=1 Tax=Thioalkalivibrio sp. ALE19 TaxID=1266909 RepID=UPI000491A3EE|nr:UDP-2,4-diacetamido-2,4,6-trideoxy-beta-L-altropyranose hydrolase [Thioalkalivibrio sp. ALE19]
MTPRKQTVVFRADASEQIGNGHVMRCLTLAEGLRERGHECHFICRQHEGNRIETIRGHGFSVHVLPLVTNNLGENSGEAASPHVHWLGVSWETDARECLEIVGELNPDWLVIDHYALDARWERCVKAQGARVLVIDDLADRPHEADLLLDQNLGRSAEDYTDLVPAGCRILVGPRYALLRPEFGQQREESLRGRRSPRLQRLLVTMGGVDQHNATGKALSALRSCPLPDDAEIEVVMGGNAPWLTEVREQCAAMPWPTRVQVDVQDMARRMVEADLAIGAAGSTSWERCCLGLPALMVVLAENQRSIGEALHSAGAGQMIGTPDDLVVLPRRWASLVEATALADTAMAASNLTDGNGTQMAIQEMESVSA